MQQQLISLLYVSEAIHQLPEGDNPVDDIVEVAQSRNAALDVTGALVFTGRNFAQVLEGSRAAVEELMLSINKDERHRDVDVITVEEITERRFPGWALAYAGPSVFVDRHIRPLVEKDVGNGFEELAADMLISLMREFVIRQ